MDFFQKMILFISRQFNLFSPQKKNMVDVLPVSQVIYRLTKSKDNAKPSQFAPVSDAVKKAFESKNKHFMALMQRFTTPDIAEVIFKCSDDRYFIHVFNSDDIETYNTFEKLTPDTCEKLTVEDVADRLGKEEQDYEEKAADEFKFVTIPPALEKFRELHFSAVPFGVTKRVRYMGVSYSCFRCNEN
jgi:hypothetical protein